MSKIKVVQISIGIGEYRDVHLILDNKGRVWTDAFSTDERQKFRLVDLPDEPEEEI